MGKLKSKEESAAVAKILLCLRSKKEFIIDGKCYVGISANPVQSLSAHGIDIHAENTFFCRPVPPPFPDGSQNDYNYL